MLNAWHRARDALAAGGLTRRFGAGAAAGAIRDAREAVLAQIILDPGIDLHRCERVVEQRGAEAYRRRAREHELERVVRRLDAALPDDWDAALAALLVDLMHFEQRDRPNRRSREAALDVADDRPARLDVDGHAHQRVDDCERIRAGLDAGARVRANVGLIRRQLRDQRLARHGATRGDDARRHVGIVAERDAAFLD